MPKARKKKSAKMSTPQSRALRASQSTSVETKPAPANNAAFAQPVARNRRALLSRATGPQSLIMPSMVALGCWGMAFSFAYFYNDPNHLLFAGMAVLMALLWTYSVYVRFRKVRAARQKSM